MNLHVFFLHIINIMVLFQCALLKTIPESNEKDGESEVLEVSDDVDSIHESYRPRHTMKHPKNEYTKGNSRKRRFDEESTKRKECAVMYKNDEPIGILEPYDASYRLLPVDGEKVPVDISPIVEKRQSSLDISDSISNSEYDDETMKKEDDTAPFSDDRYPYIFAKFKIDSRVSKSPSEISNIKQRNLHKRESIKNPLFGDKHFTFLKSTLSKIKTNDEGAEKELKTILSDMGLIDDESIVNKREADIEEDEDMEQGTNKINLIKIEENQRLKRDNADASEQAKESESASKKSSDTIDLMESGDASENVDDTDSESKHEREKRKEDVSKEMERRIKEKLENLKQEVKKEIEQIKAGNDAVDYDSNEEEVKEKIQRKKRNVVNTLMDEETKAIDPINNAEDNLKPHIRRRRSLSEVEDTAIKSTIDRDPTPLSGLSLTVNPISEYNAILAKVEPKLCTNKCQKDKYCEKVRPDLLKTQEIDQFSADKFVVRNLKQFRGYPNNDYDAINEDAEDDNAEIDSKPEEAATENKQRKFCKCNKGNKDCKCKYFSSKSNFKNDGSNFYYVDEMPNLKNDDKLDVIETNEPGRKIDKKRDLSNTRPKIKKLFEDGKYSLDLHPDSYSITEENKNIKYHRKKRNSFTDLVAIHGGGPVVNHLVAVRERSMRSHPRFRRMTRSESKTENEQLQLTDMSEEDIFGALPQSFEGGLARYKRVKRTET